MRTASCQAGSRARPEKTRLVSVVLTAEPGGVADHHHRRRRGRPGRAQVHRERSPGRPPHRGRDDLHGHHEPGAQDRRQLLRGRHAGPERGQQRWSGPTRSSRNSMSTTARASKTVAGSTGRLSRHSAPRPSRHQALTPNSSAPPEATRPGQDRQLRPVQAAGDARRDPGPTASTTIPRRIGTTRQTEPRSMRSRREEVRGRRSGRGAWSRSRPELVARVPTQRPGARAPPPSATSTEQEDDQDRRRPRPQRPVPSTGATAAGTMRTVGQGVEEAPSWPLKRAGR